MSSLKMHFSGSHSQVSSHESHVFESLDSLKEMPSEPLFFARVLFEVFVCEDYVMVLLDSFFVFAAGDARRTCKKNVTAERVIEVISSYIL